MRNTLITVALGGLLAGCGGTTVADWKPLPTSSAPAATPAGESSGSGEPSGKVTGTCDYNLSTTGDADTLTAELDVENTGGGGIVVVTSVSWPQFGRSPIKASKKVRVAEGRTATVRFNRPATTEQILSLQSWQERHDFDDGCKYKATITGTF
jgi:hypothetical protein